MRPAACLIVLATVTVSAAMAQTDPRLREQVYDPQAVVTVPVQRGVVTLILLDEDEAITEVAAGLGGDCARPESAWCIAAQPGGRHLFVKPRSRAQAPNTLAVITTRRVHSFRLVVGQGGAVYRLQMRAPQAPPLPVMAVPRTAVRAQAAPPPLPELPRPSPEALVAERLQARPQVRNTAYAMAEGPGSEDIVPTLVFDDGRFTYLRFPGNREVPAVFHVQGDGSETLVNARMEDDLLVVDRVSRRLMLRAGQAVVGLWNEAFDLEGAPPVQATTVPGVQRVLRLPPSTTAAATSGAGDSHD
ncbi:MAG: TrbG/VirB9 family P-type conjugative transfer protein [Burkholderiaceae bacterium]|nr:TrbG/VirB9 family P-type conjugative transfer protein [Burkholderiaceae bacterium]